MGLKTFISDNRIRYEHMPIPLAVVAAFVIGALAIGYEVIQSPPVGSACAAVKSEKISRTSAKSYPVHENIKATVFWVGESASKDNDFIHNRSSAWTKDWVDAYGGVDTPSRRNGCQPAGFIPKENPFYFALPYGDYKNKKGEMKEELKEVVPWYEPAKPGESLLKNRWIEVTHQDRVAYSQWQDVGPFKEDDSDYVFGSAQPKEQRAGIDLSPATAHYVGIHGGGVVSWRFVDSKDVPNGPWKYIVTTSSPLW